MRIVIATDHDTEVALELKRWLVQDNLCHGVQLLSLASVAARAAQYRPKGVILCLPSHPEQAIPLIRDIQEALQIRVVVIGPAAEAKVILQILREGAFQYIDQEEVKQELPTALVRLNEEWPAERELGSLITLVGAGGGNGSSTLAANVAAALCLNHQQCGLLDLRLLSGDLATLLDLEPAYTLADFCRNVDRMDAEIFSRCLTTHSSGVHLLAAPNSFRELSAVTARGVRKAIGMARARFPYVLVDLDSPFRPEQTQVLFQTDTVLLVMRLDFSSVRRTQELLSHFDDLELDRKRIQVVASRHGRPQELRLSKVEETLGLKIRHFVPDDARRVNRANNCGVPIVLDSPRAAVSRRLLEISHCVNGSPPVENHTSKRTRP